MKITGFRQRLRRDLLNSARFHEQAAPSYRRAFHVSAGLATALASLLALFIIQPSLPGKVHYALLSQSDIKLFDRTGPSQLENDPQILLANRTRATLAGIDAERQSVEMEADREMVRLLAARELDQTLSAIEPIAPSELYAINRFRIDNGREAVVYTQLPTSLARYRESY